MPIWSDTPRFEQIQRNHKMYLFLDKICFIINQDFFGMKSVNNCTMKKICPKLFSYHATPPPCWQILLFNTLPDSVSLSYLQENEF